MFKLPVLRPFNRIFENINAQSGLSIPLLLIIVTIILILSYFIYHFLMPAQNTTEAFIPVQELIKNKQFSPPEKVFHLTLNYNNNVISLAKAEVLNGYYLKRNQPEDGYTVNLYDDKNTLLDSAKFNFPLQFRIDPVVYPDYPDNRLITLNNAIQRIAFPYSENIASYTIISPTGEKILAGELKDIKQINNEASFNLLTTKPSTTLFNLASLFPSVHAASPTGKGEFVLAFTSHGFTKESDFDQAVKQYEKQLKETEPFKSRWNQIKIVSKFLTNINCHKEGTRTLICSEPMSQLDQLGVPFHQVHVISNSTEYMGQGLFHNELSTSSLGGGPRVFIHEIGHSMGKLFDEYVVSGESSTGGDFLKQALNNPNTVVKNCFTGTPNGQVEGWGQPPYFKGCANKEDWYRSTDTSIMSTIESPHFNPISRSHMDAALSAYIGSSAPISDTTTNTNNQNPNNSTTTTNTEPKPSDTDTDIAQECGFVKSDEIPGQIPFFKVGIGENASISNERCKEVLAAQLEEFQEVNARAAQKLREEAEKNGIKVTNNNGQYSLEIDPKISSGDPQYEQAQKKIEELKEGLKQLNDANKKVANCNGKTSQEQVNCVKEAQPTVQAAATEAQKALLKGYVQKFDDIINGKRNGGCVKADLGVAPFLEARRLKGRGGRDQDDTSYQRLLLCAGASGDLKWRVLVGGEASAEDKGNDAERIYELHGTTPDASGPPNFGSGFKINECVTLHGQTKESVQQDLDKYLTAARGGTPNLEGCRKASNPNDANNKGSDPIRGEGSGGSSGSGSSSSGSQNNSGSTQLQESGTINQTLYGGNSVDSNSKN